MSIIEKKIEEINDAYAKFMSEKGVLPKYLILDIEARQAIELSEITPEIAVPSFTQIDTYRGTKIIFREEVVIV